MNPVQYSNFYSGSQDFWGSKLTNKAWPGAVGEVTSVLCISTGPFSEGSKALINNHPKTRGDLTSQKPEVHICMTR